MARKQSERRRAQLVIRQEADLRAERDALRATVGDCYDQDCPCHRDTWIQLGEVEFLLGVDAGERTDAG